MQNNQHSDINRILQDRLREEALWAFKKLTFNMSIWRALCNVRSVMSEARSQHHVASIFTLKLQWSRDSLIARDSHVIQYKREEFAPV